MRAVPAIAAHALRESLRRRVFVVVLVLTTAFLALYAWGVDAAFDSADDFGADPMLDPHEVVGSFMFGLALFSILFLGAVLATQLTIGVVRGDAERGLLQPVLARPVPRPALLLARFLAAAGVSALYVLLVYLAAAAITAATGDGWTPDRPFQAAFELAAAAAVLAALSLFGSIFLSSTANGIAVLMLYGAGLTAGLLGQIGEAIESETLDRIATVTSWALPFEALYQDALHAIAADARGIEGALVQLGPFGGAQAAGAELWLWTLAYLALLGAVGARAFARRDL